MSQTPEEIREELALFGLSSLDDLIDGIEDDCRRHPGKRNRDPNTLLAEFLFECLTEVRSQANNYIAVLSEQEAQAQKIAEEAEDRRRDNPLESDFRRLGQ